jgi:hypothetical protein
VSVTYRFSCLKQRYSAKRGRMTTPNVQQPVIPIEEFLKPVFVAYQKNGITMSFNRVENNILYINIDKRMCVG